MKLLSKITLLAFLVGGVGALRAQKIPLSISPTMVVEESIDGAEVSRVSAAAEVIMNDYADLGHMTNDKGVTTRLAGNEFKGIFKATARIFADYLEYPGGIGDDVAAYRQTVMDRFPDRGFPYNIGNAELTSITGEGYRFFIVKIRFSKSVKAYIDGRGKIRTADKDGSRDFILELTAEISAEDLTKYKIRDIICADKCGKEAADRVRYLSATVGLGIPFTSVDKLSVPGVSSGSESYDFSQDYQVALGGRYTANILGADGASGKNIFLTGGANLTYGKYTASLTDYSLTPFPDTDFDGRTFDGEVAPYLRTVDDVFLTEKISTVNLEFPVGIGYRIVDNYDKVLMVEAVLKPSIVLAESVNWSEGSGRFDGLIEAAKFSVLANSEYQGATNPDDNPFNVCECNSIERDENSELQTGFGLWFQLSPTFYSNVDNGDPALGFQISLDLAFNLRSPISNSSVTSPYLANPRGESGLLSNGYFNAKMHYLGIRAGVYLQRVRSVNIR